MSTYREKYFEIIKQNPRIFTKEVVFSLFSEISGFDKTTLILHFDDQINDENKLSQLVDRIAYGEPYQYVIGHTTFLGNKFIANKDVLIPRQETEQLVLDTKEFINQLFNHKVSILDMCSGSGCIGISLAKMIDADVDLVDISISANKVANENSNLNKTNVTIYESDLFKNIPSKRYDVIVCNPPYILEPSTVDRSTLKYEPHIALFSSPDTYFYEEVFKAKDRFLKDRYLLAFEIGEDMEESLTTLVNQYFHEVQVIFKKDIYDKTRFLYIIKE